MSKTWKIAVAAIAAGLLVLASCGVYVVLRFTTFYASSESMAPTTRTHQVFVVDRFAYRGEPLRRDDIVVFTPPVPSVNPFYKRVVAVPGDHFAIRGGRTFLNGRPIDEPYAPRPALYDPAVRDYDMWVDGVRLDHATAMVPPRPIPCRKAATSSSATIGRTRWTRTPSASCAPGNRCRACRSAPELIGRALLPSRRSP